MESAFNSLAPLNFGNSSQLDCVYCIAQACMLFHLPRYRAHDARFLSVSDLI